MDFSKVLFTGDSLSDDANALSIAQNGGDIWFNIGMDSANVWPKIVARNFKCPYVNTAVGGAQIATIAADIDKYILSYKPTHVFIEGGYNDWGTSRTDADTIAGNMETIISAVKAAGVGVTLLWLPINYNASPFEAQTGETNAISLLKAKYAALATTYDIDYIDLDGTALGTAPSVDIQYRIADGGVHFSPSGHLKVAELVIEHICTIYGIPNAGRVRERLKKSEGV